jgi:hypothetical protein
MPNSTERCAPRSYTAIAIIPQQLMARNHVYFLSHKKKRTIHARLVIAG